MRRVKAAGTGVVWGSWMNTGTLPASQMALKYARISESHPGGAGGRALAGRQCRLAVRGKGVVLDVVPHDLVAEARRLGQGHVPIWVQPVAGVAQVRVGRVVVDARRQQALLVVLAGVLGGAAEHLQVAETGHVDLA